MIKKISSVLFVLVIMICLVTGCETKKENNNSNKEDSASKIKSVDDLSSDNGELHCTRTATIDGGSGTFNYYIKYNGEDITSINSIEKVESDDPSILNQYIDSFFVYLKLY